MPMFWNTLSVPSSYLPACEDETVCSETLAFKLQTPVNHPAESIQHLRYVMEFKFFKKSVQDCQDTDIKLKEPKTNMFRADAANAISKKGI
jgi:hypothetical protein